MQGHKKPARNYLGKQKTVKNIPIKWKSGPKTPETELAYITKAEKNLLLKKDLHGSLKHGPNTGPDGIMSLDSQGDYTRDRSPGAYTGGGGSPAQQSQATGTSQQALRNRAINEANMKAILTGQIDKGQTVSVSDRIRRGAVPEWVTTPSGKRKYVGSAYKSTGQRGFLAKLFGGRGYRGTVGTGSGRFFDRKSTIGKYNQATGLYESEEEDVGDIQPGFGGRILGGLAGLATGIPFVGPMIGGAIDRYTPKPRDMSQYNQLSLTPYNERKISIQNDMPMENLTMANWGNPPEEDQNFNNQNFNMPLPLGSAEGGRIGYEPGGVVEPGKQYYGKEDWEIQQINQYGVSYPEFLANQGWPPLKQMDASQIAAAADAWKAWKKSFKEGGRIGLYAGGDPEEPAEDIFEIMRDQNIPMSEQVEGDPFQMRIQELMGKGMSYDDAYDIAEMEFQDLFAEGSEQDQGGLASLV
jgi:hypothetical protein